MTVLVWDGRTLAADRQAGGNIKRSVTKIAKGNKILVGFVGDHRLGHAMMVWWLAGGHEASFPHTDGQRADLYVIGGPGNPRVVKFESSPDGYLLEDEWLVAGTGGALALGALAAGANARRAAEIACHYDDQCGMGIDTLQLTDA